MYQQINLADRTVVGFPGAVPDRLQGLSDAQLADLDTFSNPPPIGYEGQGFWPVIVATPASFDPMSQVLVDPTTYTVDAKSKIVIGQQTTRLMTPDELAAANPVPDSVTNYQARAALVAAGLFDKVDAAIRGADLTVQANQLALQAWDYANNFYRDQPFIVALGPSFGLKPADIDNLFRAAAKVS